MRQRCIGIDMKKRMYPLVYRTDTIQVSLGDLTGAHLAGFYRLGQDTS